MSRISLITWGLLLIFVGVQLNLVDSFVLTPRATKFWKSKLTSGPFENAGGPNQFAGRQQGQPLQGQSFSDQYASGRRAAPSARGSSFPYSTPNYRRFRGNSGGQGIYQAGFNNNPQNRFGNNGSIRNAGYGNPGNANPNQPASRFAGQKMITPPSWFCWPAIFTGAVLSLFGAARRD